MKKDYVDVWVDLGRPLAAAVAIAASEAGMTPQEWMLKAIDLKLDPIDPCSTDSRKPWLLLRPL